MVTTLNFKDLVDLPKWRSLASALTPFTTGISFIFDLRNNDDRHPIVYQWPNTNYMIGYNVKNDEWYIHALSTASGPQIGGSIASGSTGIFVPCQGPRGTVGAGCTTTSIVISTVLPGSVVGNQLANRGDGRGYKIRIIGNSAGSSGKTEERIIIANSGGTAGTTTPILTLDSPLSFTPANGDAYEFLSGRIYLLGAGTTAASNFKYFDLATSTLSGNLSVVNLAATISGGTQFYPLDELYVPYNQSPGSGFLGLLTATATGAASITGQAAGGDASVVINEYRNFQIRIIEDTAIPTAVGQRRNIASHTAGASPVYTLSAVWAVQPSATAKYVIEQNGDRIIFWIQGSTTTYCYTISTDTWDAGVTFTTINSPGAGFSLMPSFGIVPDTAKNVRQSFIYLTRAASTTIGFFDVAGGPTGSSGTFNAGLKSSATSSTLLSITSGTSSAYDPVTNQGKYTYLNVSATQRFLRFDAFTRLYEHSTFIRVPVLGTNPIDGIRMASAHFQDGSTKLAFIIHAHPSDTMIHQLSVSR